MNPKPLVELNHFTVPCITTTLPESHKGQNRVETNVVSDGRGSVHDVLFSGSLTAAGLGVKRAQRIGLAGGRKERGRAQEAWSPAGRLGSDWGS